MVPQAQKPERVCSVRWGAVLVAQKDDAWWAFHVSTFPATTATWSLREEGKGRCHLDVAFLWGYRHTSFSRQKERHFGGRCSCRRCSGRRSSAAPHTACAGTHQRGGALHGSRRIPALLPGANCSVPAAGTEPGGGPALPEWPPPLCKPVLPTLSLRPALQFKPRATPPRGPSLAPLPRSLFGRPPKKHPSPLTPTSCRL